MIIHNKPMQSRKPNRLKEYDYSRTGEYFVTICVDKFQPVFGFIQDGIMCLNSYGSIVYQQLHWLESRYRYVKIDTSIVMPNHIHVIIFIEDLTADGCVSIHESPINSALVGTGLDLSLQDVHQFDPHPTQPPMNLSLSNIIGALKTTTSKYIHRAGLVNFPWQRSFYDSIIDNEVVLNKIRDYIIYNPLEWPRDRNNKFRNT